MTVKLFKVLVDVRTYKLLAVGRRLLLSYLGPRTVPLQHDQLASQIQHDALCHAGLRWTQIENMNANAATETVQFSVCCCCVPVTCCGAFNVMPVSVRTEVSVTETTRAG